MSTEYDTSGQCINGRVLEFSFCQVASSMVTVGRSALFA